MKNGSNNFAISKKGYWCKMVYRMKKSEKKRVERYKPKMVRPTLGINWDEIFALVSCLGIIPLIITRIA